MSEAKVSAAQLRRAAVVYVRQSTLAQLDRNRESTARQYDLVARAVELGWPRAGVRVIDEDLGVAGPAPRAGPGSPSWPRRSGSAQVGIVLALEVSRLARNNADWYRLLDLAGMTDTLIADADGIYHPGLFNDRMLLGMKGTMSEAELHMLRARLDGGIRNKAARGELRRALPVGLVWGEADGEIGSHPDEAVTGVIAAIFERFAVCGSVRGVWLWLREQGLEFPLHRHGYVTGGEEITWVAPTYHAVHNVLTHPAYAGAYVFGRTRAHRNVDADGRILRAPPQLPRPNGRCSSPIITAGSSTGTPTRPTRPVSAPTPARGRTSRAPARCGRARAAARAGHLRGVRAQARRLLRRPAQGHPRLLLHRQRPARRGPRRPAPARGRAGIDAAVAEAFLAALHRPRCRPAWPPPSNSKTATTPRWPSGDARSNTPATGRPRRTPLPGGRPRQPAGGPRPGSRVGNRAVRARRRPSRTGPPRGRPPENPDPTRENRHPRPRRRPPGGVGRAHHHRPGPQAAAAHPARRGQHQHAARPHRRPSRAGAALEGRRDQRAERAAQTQTTNRSAPTRTPSTWCAASPPTTPTPDRAHPQPARPPHRPRTVVHRQ